MKQIPVCPMCKRQDNEESFSVRGYKVVVCNVCGLFFINPYPTNSARIHELVSDYNYEEIKILDPEKHYRAEVQYYKSYFPLITQECESADSILDVGCGTGHLLERLSKYPNLIRTGIELNKARAEMARKVSGCEIHQIPIENFKSDIKYDVITMINVLSHISSFDSLFNSIRSLLSKNGKLILKVGELKKNVKKRDVFDWGIPDHLHFLGINTIEFISHQYGFNIYRHHRVPHSVELFSPSTWKSSGRSTFRNVIKRIVVLTPFALPVLARFYDMTHGRSIFSSFIILSFEDQ